MSVEAKQVEQPVNNPRNHKPKFKVTSLNFDSPIANALFHCTKEGYRPPINSQSGLILLKLSGIEHVSKKVFNVKGIFLNDKKKQVAACVRAKDVDAFLLIGPLRQAMDVSDDIDETNKLMDSLGNISIDDLNYTKYEIAEKLKYKPIQKYHRGRAIEMKEIEVTVVDVEPHAQVGDLSIEYKIKPVDDDSGIYYQCDESLLRPLTFDTSTTDNFDTTYDGMVSYEMKRAMVCDCICCFPFFFFLFCCLWC